MTTSASSSSSPRPAALPVPLEVTLPRARRASSVGDLLGSVVEFGEARYVLERLLNAGGMGEVYVATRVVGSGAVEWRTSERVAVKVVRRDLVALLGGDVRPFLDEARLHLCLSHPNIVRVLGVVEQEGTLFLLMEYLEGWDLRSLLRMARDKGQRLPEETVCAILAQVADALDYVHRATDQEGLPLHIVHRDVSPSNIRFTTSGEVKLMDFGVAWSTLRGRLATRSSEQGFQGKPKYLSPEQIKHRRLDGRSDLFSLGCILVEALAGRNPFDEGHELLVLHAIETVTPEHVESIVRELPEGLKAICHKLLAREPSERYATGKEVADALRAYAFERRYFLDAASVAKAVAELEKGPEPEPAPSLHPETGRAARQGKRAALLASLALVLAVFSGILASEYLQPPPPQPPPPPVTPPPMPTPTPSSETPVKPVETEPAQAPKPREKPSTASAKAACVAGALTTTLACVAHVPTRTETGDCSVAPVREVRGHQLPEILKVYFVSLNGKKCTGDPNWKPPVEPCPADPGAITLVVKWSPTAGIFEGALLHGEAHLVKAPRLVSEHPPTAPRQSIGQLRARVTQLQLVGGPTVPVCGVLFDKDNADEVEREGIVVIDRGQPYIIPGDVMRDTVVGHHEVPSTRTTASAYVRFYWP